MPLCPYHLLIHLTLPATLLFVWRDCFVGEEAKS